MVWVEMRAVWFMKVEDTEVVFSDVVVKVNSKMKTMQRILILTDFAIYICNNKSFTLNRRILLQGVKVVRIDTENIGEFAIIVPSEYDLYLKSEKLLEILQCLKNNAEAKHIVFEVCVKVLFTILRKKLKFQMG
jgi:hypothetical protein